VGLLDALVIAAGAGLPFVINEFNKTLRASDPPLLAAADADLPHPQPEPRGSGT